MVMEKQETAVAIKTETVLATFKDIIGMAQAFTKSGMFQDAKDAAQAIVKIQAGRELGLAPVYSMQHINMIKGRLTTDANSMALMVKISGKYNYRIIKHDEMLCTILFFEHDAGKWVEVGRSTFTIEDAKRAQLIRPDSGWVKYPRAMLFSRAISQGARMYCPDAIGGMYTHEEMSGDMPIDVDVVETKPDNNVESTARIVEEFPRQASAPDEVKAEMQASEAIEERPVAQAPYSKPTYGDALTWCATHKKNKQWFLDNCGFKEQELQDEPVKVQSAIDNICAFTGWEWELPKKGGK